MSCRDSMQNIVFLHILVHVTKVKQYQFQNKSEIKSHMFSNSPWEIVISSLVMTQWLTHCMLLQVIVKEIFTGLNLIGIAVSNILSFESDKIEEHPKRFNRYSRSKWETKERIGTLNDRHGYLCRTTRDGPRVKGTLLICICEERVMRRFWKQSIWKKLWIFFDQGNHRSTIIAWNKAATLKVWN